jgi:hypothetical protein
MLVIKVEICTAERFVLSNLACLVAYLLNIIELTGIQLLNIYFEFSF